MVTRSIALRGRQAGDFFGVNMGKGVYEVAELTPVVGSPPLHAAIRSFPPAHGYTILLHHPCLLIAVSLTGGQSLYTAPPPSVSAETLVRGLR